MNLSSKSIQEMKTETNSFKVIFEAYVIYHNICIWQARREGILNKHVVARHNHRGEIKFVKSYSMERHRHNLQTNSKVIYQVER